MPTRRGSWLKRLPFTVPLPRRELRRPLTILTPVRQGERIVGDLIEDEIEVVSAASLFLEKAAEAERSLKAANTYEAKMELADRIVEFEIKTRFLFEYCWIMIRVRLSLWGGEAIGVREGFKVVSFDSLLPLTLFSETGFVRVVDLGGTTQTD
ncbi:MAG: hypothetical protein A2172_04630 [Candidatus Woykebacteria bacterium RBG_13_40_15]|uniref:Uncharacterized protein n=1 Tax=Candidatus Woykebacteria bacterium RBG_13_40_15 TaxID=1802593 RepID=A0A1G1W720_9BACT|nr:MAG: hypothetical protein A2172_04630 [Candidatus Woykebacteria bacterium RBG_13_40_15]